MKICACILVLLSASWSIAGVGTERSGRANDLSGFYNSLATPPVITSFSPVIGKTGSLVQINGSSFSGAIDVSFNGAPASFTFVSDFQLSATVPAGATSGLISVTVGATTGFSSSAFTVDDTPPDAPSISGATPASPSTNLSPTIFGTAEPNSILRIYLNGACTGIPSRTTSVDGAGNFSVSVNLPANAGTSITATAVDAAGNISLCSAGFVYVTDTSPPSAPLLVGTTPASPASNNSPTIHGIAEPGAAVRLFMNGTCAGIPDFTVVADTLGDFDVPVNVPDNTVTLFTATATDSAGNLSACSLPLVYREDSALPDAPIITGSSPHSPANNNAPRILGTAEPGASVLLFTTAGCGGAPVASGNANGSGLFSIQVSVGDNTSTEFFARAIDSAGNISACAVRSFTYVEDSNLPANAICGVKFEDKNGNGVYEPGLGEMPLAGWEIVAVGTSFDTVRTTTDADGMYCFGGLPDTSYRVYETLPAGYIQTSGEPYYSVSVSAVSQIGSIDFGNFRSGKISGTKFNDHDGNGTRDIPDNGISGWTICLLPEQLPSRFSFDHANGNVYVSLNANTSVKNIPLIGSIALGYGTDLQDVTPANLSGAFFRSMGGLSVDAEVRDFKEGGVSLGTITKQGSVFSSFFDVYLEVGVGPGPGEKYVTHAPLRISGMSGTARPSPGTVFRGGPVSLYEKISGQFAGLIDSFVVVIGTPVSASDPVCDTTDIAGDYQFANLLPGTYSVRESRQPCWLQTTPDPAPFTMSSGDHYQNVNFGNQPGGGKICVTKYYDRNHNQQVDPDEHPMAGVTFTLTGAHPSNVHTGQTDAAGLLCFEELSADTYTLTEVVPAGYEVILPKNAASFFTIAGCEEHSVLWLNAAKYTDSSFRTATPEQWASALDHSGKRKAERCRADKVDFIFNLKFRLGVLSMKFPMATSGVVRIGKNNQNGPIVSSWTEAKAVVIDFDTIPAPGQVIEFSGQGMKGKPITVTYQWSIPGGGIIDRGTLPAKPSNVDDGIKLNIPRLPMPNLYNVGEDMQRLGKFPITMGAPFGPHSVTHVKYSDVMKTFVKQTPAGPLFHTDSTHCLDFVKGRLMKNQMKAYPPDAFGGNRLLAEVLALKLNILASEEGRFPHGFGDLIYDDSAVDPTPLDSFSVAEICLQADSVLMCNTNPGLLNLIPAEYFAIIRKINLAFSSAVVDTESWSCSNLALTGVRTLKSVPYLRANPGEVTPRVRPLLDNYVEEPLAYELRQNYPNPFNPTTTIQFEVSEQARISLKVYDALGREVATLIDNQLMEEGTEEVHFDASGLTSGVYFYRIIADGIGDPDEGTVGKHFVSAKKMLLVK